MSLLPAKHSAGKAQAVKKSIEGLGHRAVTIQADSADPEAIERSVREAVSALGGLDILINSAADRAHRNHCRHRHERISGRDGHQRERRCCLRKPSSRILLREGASSRSAQHWVSESVSGHHRICDVQGGAYLLYPRSFARTQSEGYHRESRAARSDRYGFESSG